jgi:DNA-binding LacI/PurR family transcriptional regulator
MANIKQIAKMASVSPATVSRVLNNHPYVSDAKRKAVLDAVECLNYSKNLNAIHLSKGKTNIVGVILPFINHAYFSKLLEGISSEALNANYQLMLCQTNYDPNEELKALDMLKMKQVDAIIVCSKILQWEQIEPYSKFGPLVACEDAGKPTISSVYLDHYSSFRMGMQYLIDRGHTRIGICLGRANSVNSLKRIRAYKDTLKAIQEPLREEWIFYQCLNIEDGVGVVHKILEMNERPTALMVTSDQVAAGIIIEAGKKRIEIPHDLAIIGFDNQPIAKMFDLTTIDNQLFTMGSLAFQIAHDQIMKKTQAPENRELEFRLIERSTVSRYRLRN